MRAKHYGDAAGAAGEADAPTKVSTIPLICSPSSARLGMLVPLANLAGSDRNSISRSLVQLPCFARSPGEYRNASDAICRLSRLLRDGAGSPGLVSPK